MPNKKILIIPVVVQKDWTILHVFLSESSFMCMINVDLSRSWGPITALQMFCKCMLYSQVIGKVTLFQRTLNIRNDMCVCVCVFIYIIISYQLFWSMIQLISRSQRAVSPETNLSHDCPLNLCLGNKNEQTRKVYY